MIINFREYCNGLGSRAWCSTIEHRYYAESWYSWDTQSPWICIQQGSSLWRQLQSYEIRYMQSSLDVNTIKLKTLVWRGQSWLALTRFARSRLLSMVNRQNLTMMCQCSFRTRRRRSVGLSTSCSWEFWISKLDCIVCMASWMSKLEFRIQSAK